MALPTLSFAHDNEESETDGAPEYIADTYSEDYFDQELIEPMPIEEDKPIRLATFNLRLDIETDGFNAWPYRRGIVRSLIQYHDFDIFGTQEGFKHQLDQIAAKSPYSYIGVGRDDGIEAGEHSAIFYKHDRFELLNSGTFWLSETPDSVSNGWDAVKYKRICTWGAFMEIATGKEFYMFNVHYDHEAKEARRQSSLLILHKIEEIAGKEASVILTGDFNSTPNDEPIIIIEQAEWLYDSYYLSQSPCYGTVGTYNDFDLKSQMDRRIDYIWVSPNITITSYATLNELPYGRFPSDHFPVLTTVEL